MSCRVSGFLPPACETLKSEVPLPAAQPGLLQRRRNFSTPLALQCAEPAAKESLSTDSYLRRSSVDTTSAGNALDQYSVMEVLGKGSCGVVRRATDRRDGSVVALKFVRTDDEELIDITRKEFELLRTIEHANVIRGLDFFTTIDRAVVVMEFFDGVPLDVAVKLSPSRRFAEPLARVLFRQLASALACLHERGILHRDVQSQNVLVASGAAQPDLRLVDFNVACHEADGSLTPTGMVDYAAPEVQAGQSHSRASDIWAAGLCLQLMLAGRLPRRVDAFASREGWFSGIGRRTGDQTEPSDPCLGALRSCLEADRDARPTASELLAGVWLGSGSVGFQEAAAGVAFA